MKKVIVAVLIVFSFVACKKEPPGGSGTNDISNLHSRLPGKWDLVAISYSGMAIPPLPLDTTQLVPFHGEGENVTGFYYFDAIPDPDSMYFEMTFSAPIIISPGTTPLVTLTPNERGYAFYSINEQEGALEGTSYSIAPSGNITSAESTWTVISNEENRQVWATRMKFYWDTNQNNPIDVDVKMTMVR